jgi:4-diphosphocytidyl-2-C-methyl-D-erythritol kinase
VTVSEGGSSQAAVHPASELARAKVNLTLAIRGRRPDGYHELESLVLFGDFGDRLSYEAGGERLRLETGGPFAEACSGFAASNLVLAAAEAFAAETGHEPRGTFRLIKTIPIAAGLGGGSADAAAAFRILARVYRTPPVLAALIPAARTIGADVPVCLASRPALMTGIGEVLHPLPPVEPVPAVLVNPLQPLATRDVFRELDAPPLATAPRAAALAGLSAPGALLACARERGNDLEAPARRLLPVIGDILDALAQAPGARLARLSGSGPTCFALFDNHTAAQAAAANLACAHPGWWVQVAALS